MSIIAPASTTRRTEPSGRTSPPPEMYPVVLKLEGRRCLVVGGGAVAIRKAGELLRCGALVHVVAPEWRADFASLLEHPHGRRLIRSTRAFEAADLDGAALVVAATDDRGVQEQVAAETAARGILCNVVDVTELGSFHVPATLRRGSLTVSVATEGKSPLMAAALRDHLASLLGPQLAAGLDRFGRGRAIAAVWGGADAGRRREALKRLITAEAIGDLLAERMEAFDRHWEGWLRWLRAEQQ